MPLSPSCSLVFRSFQRHVGRWGSNYHKTRHQNTAEKWLETVEREAAARDLANPWASVRPAEWAEMAVAAAGLGYRDLVGLLLQKGASARSPNAAGLTPAAAAASCGSVTTLAVLRAAGADYREIDANGRTLLHAAVSPGAVSSKWDGDYAGTVQYLLAQGLDAAAPDGNGNTALHGAARRINETVWSALLEHGASWSVANHNGRTPADELVDEVETKKMHPSWTSMANRVRLETLAIRSESALTRDVTEARPKRRGRRL